MSAKFFFERFWEGEQQNQLFVCMPFHDLFDSRFNDIVIPAAKEAGFDNAIRVKEDIKGQEIKDKILYGIANSKMILIDLTDDPKSPCKYSKHVNGNVLYEAGIADAMREPSAIVMIRDQDPATADFDIRGMTINQPPNGHLSKNWLFNLLEDSLNNHKWYESKRVKAAAESIDEFGLDLMLKKGKRPKGWNHFNIAGLPVEVRMSVMRLIDLGILWFNTARSRRPDEYAYHWTPFGYEVMKYLGIKQQTMDEFEKTPEYPKAAEAKRKYAEERKRWEDSLKK